MADEMVAAFVVALPGFGLAGPAVAVGLIHLGVLAAVAAGLVAAIAMTWFIAWAILQLEVS